VQRRPAVVVSAENEIRIVFDQGLDPSQIAILGGVMYLAAEGEATPSQRDQHDGGERYNWRVAESAKERARIHGYSDWLNSKGLLGKLRLCGLLI